MKPKWKINPHVVIRRRPTIPFAARSLRFCNRMIHMQFALSTPQDYREQMQLCS